MSYDIDIKGPVDDFKKTLFNETEDLGIDLAEVTLDAFLKEGVLQALPLVRTIYTSEKIYVSVKDLILTKKVLVFSKKIQKKLISNSELKEHVELLKSDPVKLNKELEIILTYLDRQTKYTKAIILANFYLQYLAGEIEWDDFDFFAEVVDGISVYDLKVLKIVWDKSFIREGEKYNPVSLQRLRNHGLVEYHDGVAVQKDEIDSPYIASINEIGRYFCTYGMDGVWDKVLNHGIIV